MWISDTARDESRYRIRRSIERRVRRGAHKYGYSPDIAWRVVSGWIEQGMDPSTAASSVIFDMRHGRLLRASLEAKLRQDAFFRALL